MVHGTHWIDGLRQYSLGGMTGLVTVDLMSLGLFLMLVRWDFLDLFNGISDRRSNMSGCSRSRDNSGRSGRRG